MRRRLALLVLGAWIGVSAAMWVVASTNFATVDRILEPGYRPELAERIAPHAPAEERPVLRYLASELNRRFFRWWAIAQVALAAGLLALLVSDPAPALGAKLASALAAIATLVLAFALGPAIARLGPPLDFVPRPFPPEWAERSREFMRIHGAFMAVDLAKLVLLVAAAVLVARVRERSRSFDGGPGG